MVGPIEPDQGERDAGDARQARADEEGDAGRSRAVGMPLVSARSRFCTDGPDAAAERGELAAPAASADDARERQREDEQPAVAGQASRGPRRAPDSQAGARHVCTSGAPKMSRASCCRISATPKVTSSVSSGRWYIRRMQRRPPAARPSAPATTKRDRQRRRAATARRCAMTCCSDVGGVGAGHDELAVRHVDDAHLAEGQGQAERGQQQDRRRR